MTYNRRIRVAGECKKHGFYVGASCLHKDCKDTLKNTRPVIPGEWVAKETFEHIDPTNPRMRFDSPKELKKACEERGLLCKAYIKDKSSPGRGLEHSRR